MSTPVFHDDAVAPARPTPADAGDREPAAAWRILAPIGVAVLVGVLGGPLGLLWAAIGPRVQVTMTTDGPNLVQSEPEQFIADEGWYILLNIGFAVLVTVLVWLVLRRHRGPAMLLALAAGTSAAGIFAWWVGSHLGLAHYHYLLQHAPVGSVFGKPVGLRAQAVGLWHGFLPFAKGDVLVGGVASTVTYILFVGFSPFADLRSTNADLALPEPLYLEDAVGEGPAGGPADAGPANEGPIGGTADAGPANEGPIGGTADAGPANEGPIGGTADAGPANEGPAGGPADAGPANEGPIGGTADEGPADERALDGKGGAEPPVGGGPAPAPSGHGESTATGGR